MGIFIACLEVLWIEQFWEGFIQLCFQWRLHMGGEISFIFASTNAGTVKEVILCNTQMCSIVPHFTENKVE